MGPEKDFNDCNDLQERKLKMDYELIHGLKMVGEIGVAISIVDRMIDSKLANSVADDLTFNLDDIRESLSALRGALIVRVSGE